jgi:uncharacterized membrane protein
MNQLIVVGFDRLEDARKALRTLRDLERQGRVHFEDTAIVERDKNGMAHARNEVSGTTEMATAIGALLGGAIAWVFPVAGIVIGGALGAAIGAALGTGVSRDFVEDVKKTLAPGRSALFLVVKEADADALMAALRQFNAEIIQTTLPTEAEETLRR